MEYSLNDNLAELLTLRKTISNLGTIRYYNRDNQMHRIHGPAVIWPDGVEEWWINGELHREDGPAHTNTNGTMVWYHYGLKHRIDGPAFIWDDGDTEWWLNGERHREDGPAVERTDGSKEWYRNGKFIRSEPS